MVAIHGEIVGQDTLVVLAGGLGAPEDVMLAANKLKALTPLFETSDPPGALTTRLTWSAVVQLAATFGPEWWPSDRLRAWVTDQTLVRTAPVAAELDPRVMKQIPDGLAPRPYQVAGALEIARTGRCLIFDEPRTGKTITTILGLLEWALRHPPGDPVVPDPILVVCPASVVDPWVEAFETWAPCWRAVAWRGPRRKRLAGEADVYVTSYDTARADTPVLAEKAHPLLDLGARVLVIDESHYVKNHQAARTKSVLRLARDVEAFVALSGTPITHHPGDLWPALNAVAPGAHPSRDRTNARYCLLDPTAEHGEGILGLHPWTEPEFRLSIVGQHRRVARADVMSQLPPKVYSTRTVDLPPAWRKAYDEFEEEMFAELPAANGGEGDGQELSVMSVLSQLTHLSALASSAADVRIEYGPDVDEVTGELKKHVHLDLKAPSWKVDALLEVLEERRGEKVVSFAASAQLTKLAGAAAAKAGHRVGYIVGGQAAGVRTQTIRDFQTGDLSVICATTSAGGTGITLSAAGTLVFLQRPWSLVESLQAEDRAEGDLENLRGTEVIDVIARNSIDSRVRAVLRERAGQLADLVQDPRIVTELLGGSRAAHTERQAS